jgi:hypothetical protein
MMFRTVVAFVVLGLSRACSNDIFCTTITTISQQLRLTIQIVLLESKQYLLDEPSAGTLLIQ